MKYVNAFLFSNLFIVCCALLMCWYTAQVLDFEVPLSFDFYGFVASATMSSYALHWYLSASEVDESVRGKWTMRHKKILLFLFVFSTIICTYFCFIFRVHWVVLVPLALLTFLYSAPKIPVWPFYMLAKKAYAKTFYLSAIWTIVTVILPIQLTDNQWNILFYCFFVNRFLLIYTICLCFDFRDRNIDERSSILNITQFFTRRQIAYLIVFCGVLFGYASYAIWLHHVTNIHIFCIVLPFIFLLFTLRKSLYSQSDYWYYFVLDGLMMGSSLVYIVYVFLGFMF